MKKPFMPKSKGMAIPISQVTNHMNLMNQYYEKKRIRNWIRNKSVFGKNGIWAIQHPFQTLKSGQHRIYTSIQNTLGRSKNNFGKRDIWNFFISNAEAQVKALTLFKQNSSGFPTQMYDEISVKSIFDITPEESRLARIRWLDHIDIMIDGWQAVIDKDVFFDYSASEIHAADLRFEIGMRTYVKYYECLWD